MHLREREAAGRVHEHAARAQLTEAVTQQRRLQHAQRGEPDPNPDPNPNPSPSPSPNPSQGRSLFFLYVGFTLPHGPDAGTGGFLSDAAAFTPAG